MPVLRLFGSGVGDIQKCEVGGLNGPTMLGAEIKSQRRKRQSQKLVVSYEPQAERLVDGECGMLKKASEFSSVNSSGGCRGISESL